MAHMSRHPKERKKKGKKKRKQNQSQIYPAYLCPIDGRVAKHILQVYGFSSGTKNAHQACLR